ncbi:PQQ-binding-like beta-propeller repeat protein [Rhodopirellula sp. MGV]|uniref:PQQ-binding-like beta-propeller repeat protein n=1 Tax=Rhodopirellula sp. MGV TaxID=2023130 RepID=UPI001E590E81|nr:PQQ-binding-like beta-propeller repeat protein [Rhodopirellula sp. MGV]
MSVSIAASLPLSLFADDWPSWRGPTQNNHSPESGLPDQLVLQGTGEQNLVWKSEAASGISTPVVMNGRLFTIVRHLPGTPTEAEKVVALDAASGSMLWENIYNVFLTDFPAERIGWSNVTGDPSSDRVYVLGSCSLLQCIDAIDGQTIWSRSLSEEFGMLSTYGGRTNTPVIFENLVIISGVTTGWDATARPAHRFFAFDKTDGRLVWASETRPLPEDTTYSTPVVRNFGGQWLLVGGAGDGELYGIQARTGKTLWHHPVSRRGINTSPTIASDGTIFIGHGEENPSGTAMGAVVAIDGEAAAAGSESVERWRTLDLINGKSSPLLVEDETLGTRVYVVEDSSRLHVLDAATGEEIGRPLKLGTAMRGTMLYADGKIYAATSTGQIHVLRPTDEGVESLYKSRLPGGTEVGGSMVAANGLVYLPTTKGLLCFGVKSTPDVGSLSQAVTAEVVESPDPDSEITHLQIVPCEALLTPGQSVPLEVHAYNELGQPVALNASVELEVTGPATVSEGRLTASSGSQHEAIVVKARLGDVSGTARYRYTPATPWAFDFSAGEVPITWIGARYRHETRVVDGEPVLVKISTIPKGTRSQTWFGSTEMNGYTISADVMAGASEDGLPDMGLIGQRYVLDLMGQSQQLQIRTWAAQLRMAKSAPVTWKAGTWYRLKLQIENDKETNEVRLHGKVWPRDEAEPSDWTVTATDPSPNRNGSPGLFGNATRAEIFIDNVSVSQ